MAIFPPDIPDDPTEGFPNDFLDNTQEILVNVIEKVQKLWRKVFSFAFVALLSGLASCTSSNNKTASQIETTEEAFVEDTMSVCEELADDGAYEEYEEQKPLHFQRYERKREFLKMEAVIRLTLPVEHEAWMAQNLAEFLWKETLMEYPGEPQPKVASYSQLMDYYLNLQVGTEGPDINEDRRHQTYTDKDSLCIVSTWQSEDNRYTTYRVNTFFYHGGVHPLFKDFSLTFDNAKHRLLSSKEIFKPDCMDEVIRKLKSKVGDRSVFCYHELEDNEEFMESISPRWERYQTHFIPRPALTAQGVMFSYQRYEIDSYAEGELHFVLPYAEVQDLLTTNIVRRLNL